MDVQFWIYIIIGVIYFLSRVLKKPEQESGESPEPRRPVRRPAPPPPVRAEQAEKPRQLTFEELLREITEAKQTQRREPEPEYRGYEEVLESEAQSLEEVNVNEVDDARAFQAYEDAQRQVFERKSLEETLHLEDTKVSFGKFEAFQQLDRRNPAEEYLRLIRNPATLRQAVVMNEILQRKF